MFGGIFEIQILEERPGILIFKVVGTGVQQSFRNEPGGHRVQRIPETEKRGRVQTSTITIACLREAQPQELIILDRDLEIKTTRGSGAGGQARNKLETAVVITHKPSGITVRSESERSQHQNKEFGLALLRSKLVEAQAKSAAISENNARRAQLGQGQRGDKRRTIRSDGVIDHITGRRMELKQYERGHLEDLW